MMLWHTIMTADVNVAMLTGVCYYAYAVIVHVYFYLAVF